MWGGLHSVDALSANKVYRVLSVLYGHICTDACRYNNESCGILLASVQPETSNLKETTGGEFRVYRASIRLP